MYYKLAEPFAFRGFKRLPYAVRAESGEHVDDEPIFFDKPTFLELLHCDGEHDLCDLSDDVREVFSDMINAGVLIKSDNPLEPPKSYQHYKIFSRRYVDKVHWSITGKCNFRCRHCLVSAPDNLFLSERKDASSRAWAFPTRSLPTSFPRFSGERCLKLWKINFIAACSK